MGEGHDEFMLGRSRGKLVVRHSLFLKGSFFFPWESWNPAKFELPSWGRFFLRHENVYVLLADPTNVGGVCARGTRAHARHVPQKFPKKNIASSPSPELSSPCTPKETAVKRCTSPSTALHI